MYSDLINMLNPNANGVPMNGGSEQQGTRQAAMTGGAGAGASGLQEVPTDGSTEIYRDQVQYTCKEDVYCSGLFLRLCGCLASVV